ncbi:probable cyclic nucleotide-gated ion channel 14 [Neltuma alba]|uniref:probable cyclic nucleotide-gated ion channel 14 n=1 Tax=Neltuma alba TaxID=207710 RepID=UPI0010A51CF2|nr:probable cyclic nucleotide-gated ion channel 14 [Prosopis alba]
MKLKKDKPLGLSCSNREKPLPRYKLKATIHPEGQIGIDDNNRVKRKAPSPAKYMVFPENHDQRKKKMMMVFDPGSDAYLQWNRVFLGSCILALFIDPLFFYVPKAENDGHSSCMTTDSSLAIVLTCFRTLADISYLLNMLIKFRTAYVDPNSRIFGRGELVMDQWLIAKRYLRSEFIIDLLATLPLPQILIWLIMPAVKSPRADHSSNSLVLIILLQYFPRLYLIFPLSSQIVKAAGVVTKTAWAGAAYNLLLYMLASHVRLGALWYLFSFERNATCWKSECKNETQCILKYLDCRTSNNDDRLKWINSTSVFANCNPSNSDSFEFGIFEPAVHYNVSSIEFVHKYVYCLWWGLQNLSCCGQELITSKFIGETTFSILVCILGLVLFAHLIGNMQTYLQSITVRVEEWRLKRHDTEEWMKHRQLPQHLRGRVRRFLQYKWLATQGTDEESILRGLPKDLRRDIQCYLCLDLIRRVPFFSQMDDQLLDAICERSVLFLSPQGTYVVREGDPVTEMLFIIRGRLESSTTNGGRTGFFNSIVLKPGDFCGGELLSWALLPTSTSTLNLPSSTRTVKALVEVEAFALRAEDLKFVANQFRRFHSKKLQHTFRFYSYHWRTWAACFIQASWRRYKNRMLAMSLSGDQPFDDFDEMGHSQQMLTAVTSSNTSPSDPVDISGFGTKSRREALRITDIKMPKLQKPKEPDFSKEAEDI